MNENLSETIQLTPMLSLVVAMLYMMTADGEIEAHESSQLQAVVGGNDEALELAMEYVENVPLSQFLKDAPEQLNSEDRLCILCNVCDSILADGVLDSAELALFTQISDAFEVPSQKFAPYFKTLEFKNNKSILGQFEPDKLNAVLMPPHLAMAAGIVYMMSVDGNIAKEEIGQLKLMIGEFEGLQSAAMKYVRNFKLSQFLKESSPHLTEPQKLFILTIIFDTMQSDGQIEDKELNLFETIQKAYGVHSDAFDAIAMALSTKNIKPFGVEVIDPRSVHKRRSKPKPHHEGGLFSISKNQRGNGEIENRHFNNETGQWETATSETLADNIVHRTLESNIREVNDSFKNQAEVEQMAANARQKDKPITVEEDALEPNIQNLPDHIAKANIQSVGLETNRDNQQGSSIEHYKDQLVDIDSERRMESLQAEINQLHRKLDQIIPIKKWARLDTLFSRQATNNLLKIKQKQIEDNIQDTNSDLINANILSLESSPISSPKLFETPPSPNLSDILNSRLDPFGPGEMKQETATELSSLDESDADLQSGSDLQSVSLGENDVGGIRLRSLLLVVAISFPLVVFAYGLIYPTMVCQGESHQWQTFSPDGELSVPKVVEDQQIVERHLLQIRRGELNINNQRFPTYKELNPTNHFAEQTSDGFQGTYSNHVVDQMKYVFDFKKSTRELNITTKSEGVRFFDGESGRIEVFSNFKGQCENRWF